MANELAVGQSIRVGADIFQIEAIRLGLGDIQLVGKGGVTHTLDQAEFYNRIASGEIEQLDYSVEAKSRSWTPCELAKAELREGLVKLLIKAEDERVSAKKIEQEIEEYCRAKNYKRPTDRTAKGYVKRYKAYGFVGLIPEYSRRGGNGWGKKTESKKIAARLLHEKFVKDDKINLSDMERLIRLEIDKINSTRSACEQLDYVNRKTISRILLEFPKSAFKGGRLDPRTFALVNRHAVARYNIEHPFERVEIDAKVLDYYYVDENGNPCTGLTLYAMVCAFTSYPVAIYVTAGKPSEYTLLELLRFFFMPKDLDFKEKFGIDTDWVAPCGISKIILDNASENASNLILDIIRRLGIDVEYARICRGDDKPHVESFFKSIDTQLINKLPGTTRSQDKAVAGAECNTVIELKPEHHAALPWSF
ncbi:MAG: transposase, partial [Pseudomonas marincola]